MSERSVMSPCAMQHLWMAAVMVLDDDDRALFLKRLDVQELAYVIAQEEMRPGGMPDDTKAEIMRECERRGLAPAARRYAKLQEEDDV